MNMLFNCLFCISYSWYIKCINERFYISYSWYTSAVFVYRVHDIITVVFVMFIYHEDDILSTVLYIIFMIVKQATVEEFIYQYSDIRRHIQAHIHTDLQREYVNLCCYCPILSVFNEVAGTEGTCIYRVPEADTYRKACKYGLLREFSYGTLYGSRHTGLYKR